jgi:serine protease inhibitor
MQPQGTSVRLIGMRNTFRLGAGMIAAAIVVGGCASAPSSGSVPRAGAGPVVARGVAKIEPAADPRPLGAADTAFGLGVMRAWCTEYPRQNLVFSPSTLATALGMAYLGAGGATARAMARVLRLPAAGSGTLAAQLQARSRALGALDGPGVTLAASNQVWADPTLTTLPGYLNAVATGYDAGVDKTPLLSNPQRAASEINQAISSATRGHISRLVTPGMLAGIGWVLTSALYMNAKWATPFEAGKTVAAPFTPAGARPVSVPFMNGDGFRFATAAGWTAVSLPYQGGKLAMTALLPPSGAGSCALPTTAALQAMTGTLATRASGTAQVSLPKVSLSVTGDTGNMNGELKRLGMGLAFSDSADFSALSPQACCIGFVQQAATLQVGEKGTVGTAAAAVGAIAASAQLPAPTVVLFNRPYLMLVTDTSTGEPLFLATVANPAT